MPEARHNRLRAEGVKKSGGFKPIAVAKTALEVRPLVVATPAAWAAQAVAQFGHFLNDHAHCEKKAAAQALAFIAQYPEHSAMIDALAALAQEELRHFRQVLKLLQKRGFELGRDGGDPYVQALRKCCRHGAQERLLDRLLVASLVEARSSERLALIAHALPAGTAQRFYGKLAATESAHHVLFVKLAKQIFMQSAVESRLTELAECESDIMCAQPLSPRMH